MIVFLVVLATPAFAQDDANVPLGDVARLMRKKTPAGQDVIDNDNLSKVMDQAESQRPSNGPLRYAMHGSEKTFQISSPDVTCSLSFTANAKALLSRQYEQFELPAREMAKLSGPATVQGDALQISLFNGTDWHVSELAVAVTMVKRADAPDLNSFLYSGQPAAVPTSPAPLVAEPQSRKSSDQAFLYRARQAAPPGSVTIFSIPLNSGMDPDQEWHWAIVQARGYPPGAPTQQPASTAAGAPAVPQAAAPGSAPIIPTSLTSEIPAQ